VAKTRGCAGDNDTFVLPVGGGAQGFCFSP
jgi:hypothetical protein